jgi:hypothetical protein
MTTRTRKLENDEWQGYFDRLSKRLTTQTVTILVEGLDLGVQHETDHAVLKGITYNGSDDAITIATNTVRHSIQHPRDLYVQENAGGELAAIKVSDAEGHEQIVQFESSLALSASH